MSAGEDEVLIETRGRLGLVTLNRPKALNALTLGMSRRIDAALRRWADDEDVDAVLFLGEGDKAFCAGGDVRAMTLVEGPETDQLKREFFAAEYGLDYRIHIFPKPMIAIIDGITMGGGAGISMHASHRISTERTVFAMPETGLGLFPDVGGTWFLNRLPGRLGLYLGLVGTRLRAADLLAIGLTNGHIPSSCIGPVVAGLAAAAKLDEPAIAAVLDQAAANPGEPGLPDKQERIDALFAGDTVEAIAAALEAAPEPWAQEALAAIRRASPTSLKVAFRQLSTGAGLSIEEVFRMEYRISQRVASGADFPEGVRAILVDRDNAPRWSPPYLEEVTEAAVDVFFAPFPDPANELTLD